jgi:hypothetical protein
MNHSSWEERNVSIAIIAIVAALGLLGVVVLTAVSVAPQAEALGCLNYKGNGINVTSIIVFSRGHCLGP